MRTHLEIETKYDLADGQALPDLTTVDGVDAVVAHSELVLTATYFDTLTHSLAAAGATLRRRTGGTDDGWHLKLSLADGERLEVRRDLGRAQTPPAALAALVRAIVRSDPLEAVATLVNHRSVLHVLDGDGTILAELADDSVTGDRHDVQAATLRWRELEIELVDGDRALLSELDGAVRAGGTQPAGGPSKVGRVLGSAAPAGRSGRSGSRRKQPAEEMLLAGRRSAVQDVLCADPLLRLDRPGAASRLHEAVRRLQAAEALHAQVLGDSASTALRGELAWLESAVAGVHGVEAARTRIREALADQPKELLLGPVGRRADRELAAARRTALSVAREALDSQRYLDLLDSVTGSATPSPGAPSVGRSGDVLPGLADRSVRRAERRLVELARAGSADDDLSSQVRGAQRALDRALYAEALTIGDGPGSGRMAEMLGAAGVLLSELDAGVHARHVLRGAAVAAHGAGENGFTFGLLHGLEQMHATVLLRRLDKARKQVKRLRKG